MHLRLSIGAQITCVLFTLAAQSAAATGAHWAVVSEPARLVNGSPVLFRVTTPKTVQTLSGNGSTTRSHLASTPAANMVRARWASQETKAGEYPLELHAGTVSGQASGETISFEKTIRVEHQRYPRVLLKVPTRYTAPSAEDQREIAQDKEIKAEAFKTVTAEREWQGSFAAPVNAEISDVFGVERVFNGSVQSTHQGLDFRVGPGTSVAAVNRGKVIWRSFVLRRQLRGHRPRPGPADVVSASVEVPGQGRRHRGKRPAHRPQRRHRPRHRPASASGVRWQGVYLNPQTLLKLELP